MLNLADVVELQCSIIIFRLDVKNKFYEDVKNTAAHIVVIICGLM